MAYKLISNSYLSSYTLKGKNRATLTYVPKNFESTRSTKSIRIPKVRPVTLIRKLTVYYQN